MVAHNKPYKCYKLVWKNKGSPIWLPIF